MHLAHFAPRFASVFIVFAMAGCSSKTFVANAYPGEPLPIGEVALLEVTPNVRLMSVDGKRVDPLPVDLVLSGNGGARRELFLLPGTHRIVAGLGARLYHGGGPYSSVGAGSGVGVGIGFGGGGGGRLVQGSSYNDEIEFDAEAGHRYSLVATGDPGNDEEKSRFIIRDLDVGRKALELQRLIERRPFDDPYAPRRPATQPQ